MLTSLKFHLLILHHSLVNRGRILGMLYACAHALRAYCFPRIMGLNKPCALLNVFLLIMSRGLNVAEFHRI